MTAPVWDWNKAQQLIKERTDYNLPKGPLLGTKVLTAKFFNENIYQHVTSGPIIGKSAPRFPSVVSTNRWGTINSTAYPLAGPALDRYIQRHGWWDADAIFEYAYAGHTPFRQYGYSQSWLGNGSFGPENSDLCAFPDGYGNVVMRAGQNVDLITSYAGGHVYRFGPGWESHPLPLQRFAGVVSGRKEVFIGIYDASYTRITWYGAATLSQILLDNEYVVGGTLDTTNMGFISRSILRGYYNDYNRWTMMIAEQGDTHVWYGPVPWDIRGYIRKLYYQFWTSFTEHGACLIYQDDSASLGEVSGWNRFYPNSSSAASPLFETFAVKRDGEISGIKSEYHTNAVTCSVRGDIISTSRDKGRYALLFYLRWNPDKSVDVIQVNIDFQDHTFKEQLALATIPDVDFASRATLWATEHDILLSMGSDESLINVFFMKRYEDTFTQVARPPVRGVNSYFVKHRDPLCDVGFRAKYNAIAV